MVNWNNSLFSEMNGELNRFTVSWNEWRIELIHQKMMNRHKSEPPENSQ